jgi:hypothetical protein
MSPLKPILRRRSDGQILCPFCHEPVEIANAKTDEDGQAIHEECYVRLLCAASDVSSSKD